MGFIYILILEIHTCTIRYINYGGGGELKIMDFIFRLEYLQSLSTFIKKRKLNQF